VRWTALLDCAKMICLFMISDLSDIWLLLYIVNVSLSPTHLPVPHLMRTIVILMVSLLQNKYMKFCLGILVYIL